MSEKNGEPNYIKKDGLEKMRLDYAWKYFEFHAKQRTTVFNFFVVFSGFFFVALTQLLKEGRYFLLIMFSLIGIIITILFFCLERRNKQLVVIGESVLKVFEEDILFKGLKLYYIKENKEYVSQKLTDGEHGEEFPRGPMIRHMSKSYRSKNTHSIMLPAIFVMIVSAYVCVLVYGLCYL